MNEAEGLIIDLIDRLREWSERPGSWIFTQFLAEEYLGWSKFSLLMRLHPELKNEFEAVIARLNAKWVDYGLKTEKMPRHVRALMERYVEHYDDHIRWQKREDAEAIAEAGASPIPYMPESYAAADLGRFDKYYPSPA